MLCNIVNLVRFQTSMNAALPYQIVTSMPTVRIPRGPIAVRAKLGLPEMAKRALLVGMY